MHTNNERILQRGVKQSRCAIGRDAYPLLNQNSIPFFLMYNIIGGPGMNSRLSLSVREKYGLCMQSMRITVRIVIPGCLPSTLARSRNR